MRSFNKKMRNSQQKVRQEAMHRVPFHGLPRSPGPCPVVQFSQYTIQKEREREQDSKRGRERGGAVTKGGIQ